MNQELVNIIIKEVLRQLALKNEGTLNIALPEDNAREKGTQFIKKIGKLWGRIEVI